MSFLLFLLFVVARSAKDDEVTILSNRTHLEEVIASSKYALIFITRRNCEKCENAYKEYLKAASHITNPGAGEVGPPVYRFDYHEGQDNFLNLKALPEIQFYINSTQCRYGGPYLKQDIQEWALQKFHPSTYQYNRDDELRRVPKLDNYTALYLHQED